MPSSLDGQTLDPNRRRDNGTADRHRLERLDPSTAADAQRDDRNVRVRDKRTDVVDKAGKLPIEVALARRCKKRFRRVASHANGARLRAGALDDWAGVVH